MKKAAIIDYGAGNIDSTYRAVEECGAKPYIAVNGHDLRIADCIILPGVGSFADGMRNLREKDLDAAMSREVLENKKPFLGICLGMQMVSDMGSEGGETSGLGWIHGTVRRLDPGTDRLKVPHVGWNDVTVTRPSKIFTGIPDKKDFYFVHSYNLVCGDEDDVLARTEYGVAFISAVNRENIFGVQFHPEKSQRYGLQLLKNFLNL